MSKPKTVTITLRDRLDLRDREVCFVNRLMGFHQDLKRKLFQSLYGPKRPGNLNIFKKEFMAEYQITSTQYNSLKNQCDGIFGSQIELQSYYHSQYEEKEKSIISWLDHKEKVLERSSQRLEKFAKPSHNQEKLERKIKLTRFKIHHKKRRLVEVQRKKDQFACHVKEKNDFVPKVCFGSKNLLQKRQHLKENQMTPDQWREQWDFARSDAVFFLGDSTEKQRNRDVKGILALEEHDQVQLGITIPYALREGKQRTFLLSPQRLSERSLKQIRECLLFSYMKDVKKNGKTSVKEARLPISYSIKKKRFTKNKNGKVISEDRYYLQTIIQVPVVPETRHGNGAMGIDINADHLAISIVDRFGNYKRSFSTAFKPYEGSTSQNEAALGAIIHDLCDLAVELDIPIILEKLNLTLLMAKLKQSHRGKVAKKLSSLSYSKIFTLFEGICARRKVKLIRVFAGYSSMLGAINYLHLRKKITSHEGAALILARRGMGLKDYLDQSQLKNSAPHGHEILSLLQGGRGGPGVLKRKDFRNKIDFLELKGLYLQFALNLNRGKEPVFTRSHVFSPQMKLAAGT